MLLFAEGIESGPIAAGSAVAAMVGLVLWLVTKGIPAMIDRHDAAQKEQRAEFFAESQRRLEFSEKQATLSREQHAALAARYEVVVDANTKAINDFRLALHGVSPLPCPRPP